jgi:hypothetical protein
MSHWSSGLTVSFLPQGAAIRAPGVQPTLWNCDFLLAPSHYMSIVLQSGRTLLMLLDCRSPLVFVSLQYFFSFVSLQEPFGTVCIKNYRIYDDFKDVKISGTKSFHQKWAFVKLTPPLFMYNFLKAFCQSLSTVYV